MSATATRLHVRGLHEQVTDQELRQRFEPFGKVLSVDVIRNAKGHCKGFGYVDIEATENALKHL